MRELFLCLFVAVCLASSSQFNWRLHQLLKAKHQQVNSLQAVPTAGFKLQDIPACSEDEFFGILFTDLNIFDDCPGNPMSQDPENECAQAMSFDSYCTGEPSCSSRWAALYNSLWEGGCLGNVFRECDTAADCDEGEACYLGFCTETCDDDTDCTSICDTSGEPSTCATATGTGAAKVCQDPTVTTTDQFLQSISVQLQIFTTESLCIQNDDSDYCYEYTLMPESEFNCEVVQASGCCGALLTRAFADCMTGGSAKEFLTNIRDDCDYDYDQMCDGEEPLCAAVGGEDADFGQGGSGSSSSSSSSTGSDDDDGDDGAAPAVRPLFALFALTLVLAALF